MMFKVSTLKHEYSAEITYDAVQGGYTVTADVNGDTVCGSGGSLELAVYSFSQAADEYEAWVKEENSPEEAAVDSAAEQDALERVKLLESALRGTTGSLSYMRESNPNATWLDRHIEYNRRLLGIEDL